MHADNESASTSSTFSDHFSGVAAGYLEFRPHYPAQLFEILVRALNDAASRDTTGRVANGMVWDCAAGNGQASVPLGERFPRVVATDASVQQVRRAPKHNHVHYAAATAENAPFSSGSVSLLTVAQSAHWFQFDKFFGEAKRVLVPGGLIVLWSYSLLRVDSDKSLERLIDEFSEVTVGPWWPPERQHVNRSYQTIPFPFARIDLGNVDMTARWTMPQFIGYLGTWSSVSRKKAETGIDPVVALIPEVEQAWGAAKLIELRWPLTILAGIHEAAR